jgi:hypothetical protein
MAKPNPKRHGKNSASSKPSPFIHPARSMWTMRSSPNNPLPSITSCSSSSRFNETEGCYVLKSARDAAAFALHGKEVARMFPAFKIKDWSGAAPETLTLGGEKLAAGKDFNASVRGGVLLLQILRVIKDDVSVAIPGP